MFKDCALTINIYYLIGGYQTLIDLPTNFSSVIVMAMAISVTLPLLLSSIHLAVNNPGMIINSTKKHQNKLKTFFLILLCFICTPISPIILTSYYQNCKEKARKLAKLNNPKAVDVIEQSRKMKIQVVEFMKLELGRIDKISDM